MWGIEKLYILINFIIMKKIFLAFLVIIFINNFVFAADILSKTLSYKNYILNSQKSYSIITNVLNLSENQRKNFEQIYTENTKLYENNLENLLNESYKIKALKTSKANKIEVLKEMKNYYSVKNSIEKISKKEYKNLKKVLTREQKSEFSMIKKLERKEYKNSLKTKDYYKNNPRLEHFGNKENLSNSKS
jgi:Spy/CpxP family protein refolding chaperone